MLTLLLLGALALAEPADTPPEADPIEITSPVEAEAVLLDAADTGTEEAPAESAPDLSWRQWLYYGAGDVLLYVAGAIFADGHRDLGAVLIFDKLLEVIMAILTALGFARYAHGRRENRGEPERLGALQERSVRSIAEPLIEREVSQRIDELTNLQRTEIAALVAARKEDAQQHREKMERAAKLTAELEALRLGLRETLPPETPEPV